MKYAGLKIEDKAALLSMKRRGGRWCARDSEKHGHGLWCFQRRPTKGLLSWRETISGICDECWRSNACQFVKWIDPEPVNIDEALAQIAEMEAEAEKPLTCEGCVVYDVYLQLGLRLDRCRHCSRENGRTDNYKPKKEAAHVQED